MIALNIAGALDIFDDVSVGKQVPIDDGKLVSCYHQKGCRQAELLCRLKMMASLQNKRVLISLTQIPIPSFVERDTGHPFWFGTRFELFRDFIFRTAFSQVWM